MYEAIMTALFGIPAFLAGAVICAFWIEIKGYD